LTGELGVDARRVHVIPHGALTHLAGVGHAPFASDKPVVLFFGLMRPYKGIEELLEAWRTVSGAELWLVGMPRMDIEPLRARAGADVRFLPRFVSDAELAGFFARADVVVLPYREADQSGVLFTALAFGKPLVLSDVGGFPELAAATGAARTFPAGDAAALAGALQGLLGDAPARAEMSQRALVAAAGPYSWGAVARQTLALYERLLA
jgi:glycosyltransferase involved in cell wall biosynthesis